MAEVAQITNWVELQTAIADELDRGDLATSIKLWIQLFEKKVQQELRHYRMINKASANLAATDNTIALPLDFLEIRNAEYYLDTETIDEATRLRWQSPDLIDDRRAADTDADRPKYFTLYGVNMEVWPIPDAAGKIALEYYQKIPSLASNNTNWLLSESPGVYLYGSLVNSAPYLRDDPRVALWDTLYKAELSSLQVSSHRAMTRGSTLSRTPPVVLG